jgi:hypothetical protein
MAVGMAKGFADQLKTVGNALGDVAYYRPELLGLAGAPLKSHAHERGADAKVARCCRTQHRSALVSMDRPRRPQ